MRIKVLVLTIASALMSSVPPGAYPGSPAPVLSPHLGGYRYLSPVPGSQLVSPWNNILIRHGNDIDGSTTEGRTIAVTGSASGIHTGRLILLDDLKTLAYDADRPFALGETVEVRLESGVKTLDGKDLPELSFSFSVSATDPKRQPVRKMSGSFPDVPAASATTWFPPIYPEPTKLASSPCDTLPPGSPMITVLESSNPNPGDLFIAPFFATYGGAYLLIVDNRGMPMFYRAIASGYAAFDFKRQPNGLLTYFLGTPEKFYSMDSSYAVVDSFAAGNGYRTDLHELQLLPDGHALLMSYDPEPVDMSAVVPGGNPNASVVGLIIQELDAAKNVVFQWRSWDHFAITDCASPGMTLTDSVIDYVHGNAIELDHDGNLLISSRHMNEITKIDRQTGDISWRLGLHAVNNEFTFVNDSRGFSHQHDIRRLPNGHVTLFDNGNFLAPPYSRALEYELDEVNKVATQVWEYRDTPDVYGGFMGNAQRHADGTTTIGWGGNFTNLKLSDLHADGSKALGVGIEDSIHLLWSYRAFRFPWRTSRFVTDVDSLEFGAVAFGDSAILPLSVRNTSGSDVTISCFASSSPSFAVLAPLPITLAPSGSATVEVVFAPMGRGEQVSNLYVRQLAGDELVAQVVTLRGTVVGTTAVAGAAAPARWLQGGRPNPFGVATTITFTLPRPGKIRLEIIDVHGRKVDTLIDGVRAAGSYEVRWTPRNRANGMYFCRLQAGDRAETMRLVRLK